MKRWWRAWTFIGGGTGPFYRISPGRCGVLGATAAFSINLASRQYNQVIPIAGLRQESDGFYVLVVKPQKTILGEELTAEKVPVELLEKAAARRL